jgi:hypothetical protein
LARKRSDEFNDMSMACAAALDIALKDGDRHDPLCGGPNHAPGSRMDETVGEQLKHIETHITQYQCGDRNEDHLAHIIWRAAIAVALKERLKPVATEEHSESGHRP